MRMAIPNTLTIGATNKLRRAAPLAIKEKKERFLAALGMTAMAPCGLDASAERETPYPPGQPLQS
jgi:hypothetical protein